MLGVGGEIEIWEPADTAVGRTDWGHPLPRKIRHHLVELSAPLPPPGPSNPSVSVRIQGNSYRAPTGDIYSMFMAVCFVAGEWIYKM